MTLMFILLSVLLLVSTQVHGKALSVNSKNNGNSGSHKIERDDGRSTMTSDDMTSLKQSSEEIDKIMSRNLTRKQRPVTSDNIVFPSNDDENLEEKEWTQTTLKPVESTTIEIPNRVIFNSPEICNPGEKKDSKGRCRKTIVSRFEEDSE